jgi:flavin reductase
MMESIELDKRPDLVHNLLVSPQDAKANYRNAMSAVAGAVNIVSTCQDGRRVGFAATAVCSVSDEPPTLLVCVNHNASVYEAFRNTSKLCVNTLAADQEVVSRAFGGKTSQEERFGSAQWSTLTTGSPVLIGATAAFDCRVERRVSVGTHDVMFCVVECVKYSSQPTALLYFGRSYHELA